MMPAAMACARYAADAGRAPRCRRRSRDASRCASTGPRRWPAAARPGSCPPRVQVQQRRFRAAIGDVAGGRLALIARGANQARAQVQQGRLVVPPRAWRLHGVQRQAGPQSPGLEDGHAEHALDLLAQQFALECARGAGSAATSSIITVLPASRSRCSQAMIATGVSCRSARCEPTPSAHHSWLLRKRSRSPSYSNIRQRSARSVRPRWAISSVMAVSADRLGNSVPARLRHSPARACAVSPGSQLR